MCVYIQYYGFIHFVLSLNIHIYEYITYTNTYTHDHMTNIEIMKIYVLLQ